MYHIIVQPCLLVKWNIICKATNKKPLSACAALHFGLWKGGPCWNRLRCGTGWSVSEIQGEGAQHIATFRVLFFRRWLKSVISHMVWKRPVSLASKLLFKYTIHSTTETVLPNLSKYSHMLKDGINIIYCQQFSSDYMECLPAAWSKCPSLHYGLYCLCLMEWSVKI